MRQKFGKLTFVHVCEDMPETMKHFDSGFDAIIDGTYSQIYGGVNTYDYRVYKIENDKIVNRISWYKENQLTLPEIQNKEKAEEMIEDYHFRSN